MNLGMNYGHYQQVHTESYQAPSQKGVAPKAGSENRGSARGFVVREDCWWDQKNPSPIQGAEISCFVGEGIQRTQSRIGDTRKEGSGRFGGRGDGGYFGEGSSRETEGQKFQPLCVVLDFHEGKPGDQADRTGDLCPEIDLILVMCPLLVSDP